MRHLAFALALTLCGCSSAGSSSPDGDDGGPTDAAADAPSTTQDGATNDAGPSARVPTKLDVTLTAGEPVTADVPFDVAVTVRDQFGDSMPSFAGKLTLTSSDPTILESAFVFEGTENGTRVIESLRFHKAGPQTIAVAFGALVGTAQRTVVAATGDHLVFTSQPADGTAGEPLPPFGVALYDAWNNVASNTGFAIDLRLGANPTRARVLGTATKSTINGAVAFTDVSPSKAGSYRFVASGWGLTPATSDPFTVSFRPATLTAPTASQSGGCVDVGFDVSQSAAAPVDLALEYDVVGDVPDRGWQRATQAGSAIPVGTTGSFGTTALPTTAAPASRRLRWDAYRDLGTLAATNVALRLTAKAAAATTMLPFPEVAFDATYKTVAKTSAGVPTAPRAMAVADLDKDGRPDVVVPAGNTIRVFRGAASGWSAPLALTFNAAPALDVGAIAAGDLNGDGVPDIVLADRSSQDRAVVLLMGFAAGDSTPAITETVIVPHVCNGASGPGDVAIGRWDALGPGTAVFTCESTKDVVRLSRNAQGSWTTTNLPKTTSAPTTLAIADLDRSGGPEIVVGTANGMVQVLTAGAGGSFATTPEVSSGSASRLHDIAIADLDGSGSMDLVAGSDDTKSFRILWRTASTFFGGNRTVPAPHAMRAVAIADLDADGILDIVGASVTDDAIVVARSPKFTDPTAKVVTQVIPTGGAANSGPIGLAIVDANFDRRPDILYARAATANTVGRQETVLTPMCDPRFDGPGHLPTTLTPTATKAVDFNGDGKVDVVGVYGATAAGIDVFFGSGNGRFEPEPSRFGLGESFVDVATGDLNGDGKKDLLARRTDGVLVAAAQGANPRTLVPLALDGFVSASDGPVVMDVDLDGHDDVAYLHTEPGGAPSLHVHYQTPTHAFTHITVPLGTNTAVGLVGGDLDGDGTSDFAFTNQGAVSDELCVVWSPLPAAFNPFTCASVGGRLKRSPQITDLEGDGTAEIVLTTLPQRVHVYRANGPKSFSALENGSDIGGQVGSTIEDFALLQMDDGHLDLVTESSRTSSLPGFRELMTHPHVAGGFGDGQWAATAHEVPNATLLAGDFDGDGLTDVLLGGSTLARRPSEPEFVDVAYFNKTPSTKLGFGDFNHDGIVDLVSIGPAENRVVVAHQQVFPAMLLEHAMTIASNGRPGALVAGAFSDEGGAGFATTTSPSAAGPHEVILGTFAATSSPLVTLSSIPAIGPIADLTHGDFDGDGRDDIAYVNQSNGAAGALLLQRPGASWETHVFATTEPVTQVKSGWFPSATAKGAALRMGIAGLGRCDGSPEDCFSVFTTDTSAGTTYAARRVSFAAPAPIRGWDVGDVNNDGLSDIAFVDDDGRFGVFVQTANGFTFVDVGDTISGGDELTLADVDRDGWLDAIVRRDGPHTSIEVIPGSPSATFTARADRRVESFGYRTSSFGVFDFYGMGRPQLLGTFTLSFGALR